ncbi:MAG: AbrB/MazE/SpoVT family DNA-binding domain-containing protein [Bauldia sp.]
MRVNAKGQVTIPTRIRQATGLHPGVEVEFNYDGGEVTLRKRVPAKTPVERGRKMREWLETFRGSGTANRHLTTDEIMRLLRGDD